MGRYVASLNPYASLPSKCKLQGLIKTVSDMLVIIYNSSVLCNLRLLLRWTDVKILRVLLDAEERLDKLLQRLSYAMGWDIKFTAKDIDGIKVLSLLSNCAGNLLVFAIFVSQRLIFIL